MLLANGDGDIITISLLRAYRCGDMGNIDLCFIGAHWELDYVVDIQEAANKLGSPTYRFGSIYTYCALMYMEGCDYVEKMNFIGCDDLNANINKVFRAGTCSLFFL